MITGIRGYDLRMATSAWRRIPSARTLAAIALVIAVVATVIAALALSERSTMVSVPLSVI